MNTHISAAQSRLYDSWLHKYRYYHRCMLAWYRFIIEPGTRVLHVGCKNGYLLHAVKAAHGVGIEIDTTMLTTAQNRYPHFIFYPSIADVPAEQFDYIVLSSILGTTDDVQDLLISLQPFCHERTRIILDWHSPLWRPMFWIAHMLRLRQTYPHNWLWVSDMRLFAHLAHFEVITAGNQLLLPIYVPGISWLCNNILANIPGISTLCMKRWLIMRTTNFSIRTTCYSRLRTLCFDGQAVRTDCSPNSPSISIVIPCKNERGNIEQAILRIPQFNTATEIIFVDGHSKDGTFEEMQRVASCYPDKNIRLFVQPQKGKANAVHFGFQQATGDILMILDGDLTSPPEELPKFYDAITSNRGEFVNGARLIYVMEKKSMFFLNWIANHGFAWGFSWVLGQPIKDTLCGTKVLYKSDYERIAHTLSFFGVEDPFGDFDLLLGAGKLHLKIIDIPIHYKARSYGSTQIRRFYNGLFLARMWLLAAKRFKLRQF